MSGNIYDTANQLERELRESEQFVALKKAFEAVRADEVANKLLEDFRQMQQEIQMKQMTQAEFTEEDQERANELTQQLQENELTKDILVAEQQLNTLMNDVNTAVMRPVQELYE